jgi:hypothetical protein
LALLFVFLIAALASALTRTLPSLPTLFLLTARGLALLIFVLPVAGRILRLLAALTLVLLRLVLFA